MSSLLVSIIMPIYNRLDYVKDALNSLLAQEHAPIEIIIVDDGSTTDVQGFISKNFSSDKIRFFKKPHTGLSDSLNRGILESRGDFIVFLDDDDLLHPQMISESMRVLLDMPCDMVVVGYQYFTGELNTSNRHDPYRISSFQDELLNNILRKNFTPINTLVLKKSIIQKAGLFNVSMETCMDWDLWCRVMAQGVKIEHLNQCLSFVRVHQNNMSRNTVLMRRGHIALLRNAERYLTQEQKSSINFRRIFAIGLIVNGWYIIVSRDKKEGRNCLFEAIRRDLLFLPVAGAMFLMSYLPSAILKAWTRWVEAIINRKNVYLD
ncbi:MAG: glycosyltransferase [Candidatus Omnitrophica bacterium]|nr:glycosyltransferase [Candidatus Omnitrophota bacterium]